MDEIIPCKECISLVICRQEYLNILTYQRNDIHGTFQLFKKLTNKCSIADEYATEERRSIHLIDFGKAKKIYKFMKEMRL